MRNWKTTAFGIASIAVYVIGYFMPEYKDFATGLVAVLVAAGLISAKDFNVSGKP